MGKSRKDAAKKAGNKPKKIIHPKSREAKRQNRQLERTAHVGKKKDDHAKLAKTKCAKMAWFHENMDLSKETYTDEEMFEVIRSYIIRHESEIEFLRSFQRPGEPLVSSKANKVLMFEQCRAEEETMLDKTGFEAPNVSTAKLMDKFRTWDRSLQYMQDRVPLKMYCTIKSASSSSNPNTASREANAMDM